MEVYPGGISKPGRVIGVTVALVIVKSLVTHLLYLLAKYPSRYAAWALPCYILFGIATTTAEIAELLLIARFVPKSKIESPRDVFNICGPVVVEVLSALLMCLRSHSVSNISLGQEGDIFENFNSHDFAGFLTGAEKSALLRSWSLVRAVLRSPASSEG